MNKFYQRFREFMRGRNGVDELGRDVCFVSLALALIDTFSRSFSLSVLTTAGYFYSIFRILSRNVNKRINENRVYRIWKSKLLRKLKFFSRRLRDLKDYHYYTCPKCGQKLRVPRGKGKIEVTCPKCGHKFDRNS